MDEVHVNVKLFCCNLQGIDFLHDAMKHMVQLGIFVGSTLQRWTWFN